MKIQSKSNESGVARLKAPVTMVQFDRLLLTVRVCRPAVCDTADEAVCATTAKLTGSVNRTQSGVALLIVLFMVSFLFVFVSANLNSLAALNREIKLVDQRQKAHWNTASTNQIPARTQEAKQ